jgi:hypothetical protein
VVDIRKRAAAADLHELRLGIDAHPFLGSEVDDQSSLGKREARRIVAAAAHGHLEALLARVANRGRDVRSIRAADDHRRPDIDTAVVDLARFVVLVLLRSQHSAAHLRAKLVNA